MSKVWHRLVIFVLSFYSASENMRPFFFSRYEWWYHILTMPVFLLIGNYYFIGERYFHSYEIFWKGTLLVFFLYWFSLVALTALVRYITDRYPGRQQTFRRLFLMLLSVAFLTMFLAVFDVWMYSRIRSLGVPFNWQVIWPIMVLGFVFDLFLCSVLGLFYSLEKWKQNQAESEKQERIALQNQFNELKGQINPYFLFNSLNTLLSQISEDQESAVRFVEDLSVVYRYILQASGTELVQVSQEVGFLKVYSRLLNARYGDGVVIDLPELPLSHETYLPPLTFQLLLDNAILHNTISAVRPLNFYVAVKSDNSIEVGNNVQLKVRPVGEKDSTLDKIRIKYADLGKRIRVDKSEHNFSVWLPHLGGV